MASSKRCGVRDGSSMNFTNFLQSQPTSAKLSICQVVTVVNR